MGLQTSVVQTGSGQLDLEVVALRCKAAKDFEDAGEFHEARESLREIWAGVGTRPETRDLPDDLRAEVLLRAGTLTGWLGSAKQVTGAQEAAKDLITESSGIFERLGNPEKLAEARIDLAICYLREGALDEARVTLRLALNTLGDLESEQRIRALTNSAIVEQVATRFDEALKIYRESGALVDASSNDAIKGRFHNSYAIALKGLGLSQDREDYIDHALVEFAAARYHFEQAGHKRFRARVENNEGFLFASLGRYKEAHEHLDRARSLHLSVGDHAGAAGADDTRAQVLLMQEKYDVAERVARSAVRSLERGDEQSVLAEALTTHGKALARLNQQQPARTALDRAMEVARLAGDPTSEGIAALTMIEELGKGLPAAEMYQYFQTADSGLSSSQHRQVRLRIGECARQLVFAMRPAGDYASEGSTNTFPIPPNHESVTSDWPENYSLESEVLNYEANLIRKALEATGGSVTRAARLLGVTHQGLAFILNGRHKDLLAIRTPVKRRRRSIIRYH